MEETELAQILREVERASDARKRRAIHLVRTMVASQKGGPNDSLAVDAESIPEEVYHVMYHMLTGAVLPVQHARLERAAQERNAAERASLRPSAASFPTLYWFAQLRRPGGRAVLRDRGVVPSAAARRLLNACKRSGHTLVTDPPACVRPSVHFGQPVGDGLFALAPFLRGQMITQFTGAIHDGAAGRRFMVGNRQDYVIQMRYLGRDFTIDPLDAATHRIVVAPNYAAYINEPSAPPFARMTNARHEASGRNVLVHRYDHLRGMLHVEFADGRMENVAPEGLSTEATRALSAPPYRANCAWFDFPVPLNDLYRKVRVRDNGIRVYRRTARHACTVTVRGVNELLTAFEAHTNQSYSFAMSSSRASRIAVGDVLTLRDERMEGLRRHGVVVRVGADGRSWDVHFRLKPDVAHRLPRTVHAGPAPDETYDVPFPCIHACRDVEVGEELL